MAMQRTFIEDLYLRLMVELVVISKRNAAQPGRVSRERVNVYNCRAAFVDSILLAEFGDTCKHDGSCPKARFISRAVRKA
jgi:hypothetical protein